MIPFKDLCEMLTCHQRYSYFIMPQKYVDMLDESERQLVHIECRDGSCNLWYPKEKYEKLNEAQVKRREMDIRERLLKAAKVGDFDEVMRLKEQLKGTQ